MNCNQSDFLKHSAYSILLNGQSKLINSYSIHGHSSEPIPSSYLDLCQNESHSSSINVMFF